MVKTEKNQLKIKFFGKTVDISVKPKYNNIINKKGGKQMAKKNKKRLSRGEIAKLVIDAVIALAALITAIKS